MHASEERVIKQHEHVRQLSELNEAMVVQPNPAADNALSTDVMSTTSFRPVFINRPPILKTSEPYIPSKYCNVIPLNCISHSRTLSICIELRSLRSSYSSFIASSVNENVARPREASRPANTPYGPPEHIHQRKPTNRLCAHYMKALCHPQK